jgi:hypothetical protein
MRVTGYNCGRIVRVNSTAFMWSKTRPFLVHFTKFFKLKLRCVIKCLGGCWMSHTHSALTNTGNCIVVTVMSCLAVENFRRPFLTLDSNSRFQCVQSVGSAFYNWTFCSFVVMAIRDEWLRHESFIVGWRGCPVVSEEGLIRMYVAATLCARLRPDAVQWRSINSSQ